MKNKKDKSRFYVGLVLAVLAALMGFTAYGSITVSIVVLILGIWLISTSKAGWLKK